MAPAYGVFDREFGFDSHEWRCSDATLNHPSVQMPARTSAAILLEDTAGIVEDAPQRPRRPGRGRRDPVRTVLRERPMTRVQLLDRKRNGRLNVVKERDALLVDEGAEKVTAPTEIGQLAGVQASVVHHSRVFEFLDGDDEAAAARSQVRRLHHRPNPARFVVEDEEEQLRALLGELLDLNQLRRPLVHLRPGHGGSGVPCENAASANWRGKTSMRSTLVLWGMQIAWSCIYLPQDNHGPHLSTTARTWGL